MSPRLRRHPRRLHRHHASPGTLQLLDGIPGPQGDGTPRRVVVSLPPGHGETTARWPVVYMHDGQNLFDDATSFAGSWRLGEALASASRLGAQAIVVGVWNGAERRLLEYGPFEDPQVGGGGAGDYVDWLADVLRPVIDARFRTVRDRLHTGVAGSSMGGLVSLYALFKRPDVFGFAGVMSPSLWFAKGAIFDYVAKQPWHDARLYLDIGGREGERMVANARRMRDLLVERGYPLGERLRWHEDAAGVHHESAWGRRFRKALPALLRVPGHSE
jgi:predicted alpha/beta superfamily hydrolase